MSGRFAERFRKRDWFRPSEVDAMAADLGLRLAGPARIAASVLNDVVMCHRVTIHQHLEGKSLTSAHRANANQARRRLVQAQKLMHMLTDTGDGFTGPYAAPDNRDLL